MCWFAGTAKDREETMIFILSNPDGPLRAYMDEARAKEDLALFPSGTAGYKLNSVPLVGVAAAKKRQAAQVAAPSAPRTAGR